MVANKELQFKLGDSHMVNAKNIMMQGLTKKLDYRDTLRSKFPIKKLIGIFAYKLKFPTMLGKIHRVFYIRLLEPY